MGSIGPNMKITDFHAHILPMMDDGSQSPEESIQMLKLLKSQGVDRVVATPHFYPKQEDPDSFLERRQRSVEMLRSAIAFAELKDQLPTICIGAEVAYYNGMSLSKRIKDLCIEGTNVMLLEMPFCKWSDAVVNEVCKMQMDLGLQIVLAHINRYYQYVDAAKLFKLKSYRVMMQVNADPFIGFWSCRRAIKLVNTNVVGVLGSDAHNLEYRPPNMDVAIQKITDKGCGDKLLNIMRGADELLADATALV